LRHATPLTTLSIMTGQALWTAVDEYLADSILPRDEALDAALRDSAAAGLPSIQVSPLQGKLLHVLALSVGAKRILEIGTLGGYSTIWLGRAVAPKGGKVITLEYSAKHADVARANISRAGLSHVVDVRVGRALDSLPVIEREGGGSFDFVFIDADKPATTEYFEWALKLTRPGGMIVVDNVVRKGAVIEAQSSDEDVQGMRRFMGRLAREKRVTATGTQIVGSKGYDGLVLAHVNA
jgi:predicted O-methyltransferase YrrM